MQRSNPPAYLCSQSSAGPCPTGGAALLHTGHRCGCRNHSGHPPCAGGRVQQCWGEGLAAECGARGCWERAKLDSCMQKDSGSASRTMSVQQSTGRCAVIRVQGRMSSTPPCACVQRPVQLTAPGTWPWLRSWRWSPAQTWLHLGWAPAGATAEPAPEPRTSRRPPSPHQAAFCAALCHSGVSLGSMACCPPHACVPATTLEFSLSTR